jgi:hypothetical protein
VVPFRKRTLRTILVALGLGMAVAATDVAVYVQGHQRWLDNPQGSNAPSPGAVSRPGIGAINWVGSDTDRIGGETRRRIALMPAP